MRGLSSRLQTLFILVGLVGLFGVASPHFLTTDNLLNVMQQSAINAILGIGLTFVIISAGIDLSVGSILALCGLVTADLLVTGSSVPVAILGGVAVGLVCGLVNGLVTTLGRIPPFITTLGMMLVARSAAKIYSDSKPISGLPESFRALSGDILGIPVLVIVVAVLYVVAHLVLTRTKLGRYTYAIGGNEQAAWLSGVPVGRYKIAIYGLSGLMAGVAAVLMTSRLNAASPLTGEMYELYAIAAAVIGGVSLMGGEGRVLGTLIGALIMGTLRNGLNALNVPSALEGMVVGGVLVAAVVLDRARHRGVAKAPVGGWRRFRTPAVVGVLAVVSVAGAVAIRAGSGPSAQQPTLTVAFVPKALNSPFWGQMQEAGEAEAEALGINLVSLAADRETDVERQYQIIENLIQQRVGAILLAPSGSKELVPAISKANDAGIPVLLLDTRIDEAAAASVGAEVLTYIGSDNFEGGAVAGRYLAAKLGGVGEIAVIEGISGHETADQRRLGFLSGIEGSPGLKVVASQTADWERARAYTVAENLLQAHPGLDAVFAANDEMALGALEAIDAAGRISEVAVIGFDAIPDALANIRSGRMLGSVAQFPSEMGRLGVRYAVELLRSGKAPPVEVLTRVELIDAHNVDDFAPPEQR
ncbi:MAG TPA: substrate-binding domain-containing protein [Candidatus Sulfomarinibacteraceae bacterium]|nr:substrate-binding domain-containing protein [Candidatus Sulfomarinibacteraceae bacterium]